MTYLYKTWNANVTDHKDEHKYKCNSVIFVSAVTERIYEDPSQQGEDTPTYGAPQPLFPIMRYFGTWKNHMNTLTFAG